MESFEIRDDIWDVWGDRTGGGVEGRRNKKEIQTNKVVNVKVWDKYNKSCGKAAIVGVEAAGGCSAKG